MKSTNKIWTKNFSMIALIHFLIFFGFYLVTPTLPIHVKNLGATDQVVGWVNGVFRLAGLLIRPLIGVGLDRFGRKSIFLAGIVLLALTTLSYGWLPVVGLILLARFVYGFAWGASSGAANTIASDNLPKPRLAEGMGYFALAGDLAIVFAPILGLSILLKYSFATVASFASVLLVLSLLLALFITYRKTDLPVQPQRRIQLFEKTSIRPALVTFLITITYGAINSFVALYALDRGIENSGWFFVVMALTMVVCKPRFGRIADRYGADVVIIPAMFFLFAAVVLLSAATTLTWLLLSALVYGIGFGTVLTNLQSLAVRYALPERIGSATSIFFTGYDAGNGLGSILLGIIATRLGYSRMFLISSLAIVLAFVLYAATRKQAGKTEA